MKILWRSIVLITGLAALVAIAALMHDRAVLKERLIRSLAGQQASEILANKVVLEQIRANDLSNAVELLEGGIDSGMLVLTSVSPGIRNPSLSQQVSATIEAVKQYRRKYPRPAQH